MQLTDQVSLIMMVHRPVIKVTLYLIAYMDHPHEQISELSILVTHCRAHTNRWKTASLLKDRLTQATTI